MSGVEVDMTLIQAFCGNLGTLYTGVKRKPYKSKNEGGKYQYVYKGRISS